MAESARHEILSQRQWWKDFDQLFLLSTVLDKPFIETNIWESTRTSLAKVQWSYYGRHNATMDRRFTGGQNCSLYIKCAEKLKSQVMWLKMSWKWQGGPVIRILDMVQWNVRHCWENVDHLFQGNMCYFPFWISDPVPWRTQARLYWSSVVSSGSIPITYKLFTRFWRGKFLQQKLSLVF